MHLLEPTAPDSLVSWGYFHAAFEQKEYMEDYVAEEEARKMLAQDPKLRASFDAELARDPALARDPRRRLRFFYRRHPAWDERLNLYPILRLEAAARPRRRIAPSSDDGAGERRASIRRLDYRRDLSASREVPFRRPRNINDILPDQNKT